MTSDTDCSAKRSADHTERRVGTTERGSVLVFLLLLMIPLMALSSAMISMGVRQVTERESARGRKLALLNAESGIDHGLAQLLSDPNDFAVIVESYEQGDSLRYKVDVADLGADGIDNDGDGLADNADEATLRRFDSRGALNVLDYDADGNAIPAGDKPFSKHLRAYGRVFAGLPQYPWAVYLGDPNAEIDFNGNSFQIDGNDYDVDGNLSGAAAVFGIATTGDTEDIEDQLTAQQVDNVNGDPSISSTGGIDLQEEIDKHKASASIKFEGGTKYHGDLGDPNGSYLVTHSNGTLEISGGSVGAGLLLVEGNLDISGAFDYTGVIIVTGQVIFRGGGGGKRVLGSLLVGGDVIDASNGGNNGEDLEVSGTVDILYSSEAQSMASEAVATLTVFGWQEL